MILVNTSIESALEGANDAVKKSGVKKNIRLPSILPLPNKIWRFLLFLMPVFARLSSAGALSGKAASIIKMINDTNAAKHELEENKRHDMKMGAISSCTGMFLKSYKKGLGLSSKSSKNVSSYHIEP